MLAQNSSTDFPKHDSSVLIQGPAGQLELMTTHGNANAPIVVICHPHPLFEGTMHNKVVTTLAKAMINLGLSTVRFNFRGVGSSGGQYGDAIGELDDLRAVLTWLQLVACKQRVWLAGFSFGSYIAAKVAEEWPVGQLISIAPPVDKPYFGQITQMVCPWMVIQGDMDEVVSSEAVWRWVAASSLPIRLIKMEEAGHFFHGRLLDLRAILERELGEHADLQGLIENDSHLA